MTTNLEKTLLDMWLDTPYLSFIAIVNSFNLKSETAKDISSFNLEDMYLRVLSLLYKPKLTFEMLIHYANQTFTLVNSSENKKLTINSQLQQLVEQKLLPNTIISKFNEELKAAASLPGCPRCNRTNVTRKYKAIIDTYKTNLQPISEISTTTNTIPVLLNSFSLVHITNMLPEYWCLGYSTPVGKRHPDDKLQIMILTHASLKNWQSFTASWLIPTHITFYLSKFNFSVLDYVRTLLIVAKYRNDDKLIENLVRALNITFFSNDCLEEEWE